MTENQPSLPNFDPALPGFRSDEFLTLTETLLAIRIEQDQALLNAAPFRLDAPEPMAEAPLPPLPPRWYPRPAEAVIEAARASLVPPPRPPLLEGRPSELERIMRPLLSGHPVTVLGEPGVGKTAVLATVAAHERTRQRFRRIWWIDHPARLDQTLALALKLPHLLLEPDPARRRGWLASHLDDNTLLIVDNVAPGENLDTLRSLTAHILIAVETVPELLDPDEPLPDDPSGVVTLRALADTPAADALAAHAGIEDTRKLRGDLVRIAHMLGNHPFALMLAGRLVLRDSLSLAELEDMLTLPPRPMPNEEPEGDDDIPHLATLNRALDVSVAALPHDYRVLFETFAAFPPDGAPFDGLHAAAKIGNPLACRRGLIFLAAYGLIQADHRDPNFYTMHPVAYACASRAEPHGAKNPIGRRMRGWALDYARAHSDDPLALYGAESSLSHALDLSQNARNYPLDDLLRPYLYEYVPGYAGDITAGAAEMTGPRAEGTQLTAYGLELIDQGAYFAAEEALSRALVIRQEHDSPHAIAEALVALGRLYDRTGRFGPASEALVEAAELVYNLNADQSLSVVRRGLARVYRHMGRLNDALGVLDDAPEAHLERGLILRLMGNYPAAVDEIDEADDATPYIRAETLLLAGRYGDALVAIQDQDDSASAHLRAQVYHLQGHTENALRGYKAALACCPPDDPARAKILRGMAAALAMSGQYDPAREALEAALDLQREDKGADPALLGRTLRLLAAVYLVAGQTDQAIDTARQAISELQKAASPADAADAYRTLGRALWSQNQYEAALNAFEGEVEFAQSMTTRDEARIGLALHHLADAYRATDNLERAIANYRRALSHKNPTTDPDGYFITQLALHHAMMEQSRFQAAGEVSQEIIDHLLKRPRPDLAQYGYAQAIRARTQQAMQRPIRANQSLGEWMKMLAARADEAAADPRPALRVLMLGLAVRSLLAENRPALAEKLAEDSLRSAETHYPGALPAWAARRDLGELYAALDRFEESILTLEPLLADEVRAAPATFALAHEITGRAYRQIGDLENALAHLQAAFEHEPEPFLKGLLQEKIGDVQLEHGQPTQAVDSLRAALPLISREEHADVTARILTGLAHTLGGLNRYAEAIDVYEDALTVLRDVPDVSPTHTADVLKSLGRTHEAQGQLAEAARAYRRALNVLERADSPHQSRDILHLLARVTAAQGDASAVSLYEQTRDETRQWGTERDLGEVLCELADVHRDAGRLNPAIQNYQAALDCLPAHEFPRERARALRNLGRAFAQMERYEDARAAWTEALELSHDLPDRSPYEIALTYHAIAEAHRVQAHYDQAETTFREALRFHTPGTVEAAATWRALGQALHAAGQPDDAIEPLERALEIEKNQPQQANARLVQSLQLLAAAHEAREDLMSAIARHHETLVYMDRRLQPVAYTNTLRTLAHLYNKGHDHDQALVALNEALEIEGAHVPRSDERISLTLQTIADTYRAAGQLEKAAEYYQKVTVYANLARRASQDLRATLDELDRRRETLHAAQQSLALLDRSDNTDIKDLAFIHALIARSHANLNQPRESAEAIRTLLDELAQRRDMLDPHDERSDYRALAWLAQSQSEVDLAAAQDACRTAFEAVQNANLRWVIEQVARSLV